MHRLARAFGAAVAAGMTLMSAVSAVTAEPPAVKVRQDPGRLEIENGRTRAVFGLRDDRLCQEYSAHYNISKLLGSPPGYVGGEIRPLLEVRPEYLEAAFEAIDERYGSFDNYLRDGLEGRKLEALRCGLATAKQRDAGGQGDEQGGAMHGG